MRGWGSHRSARRSMRFQLRRRVRWLRRRSALSQCLVTASGSRGATRRCLAPRSSCSARAGRWPASVPGRGSGDAGGITARAVASTTTRLATEAERPVFAEAEKRTSWPGPSPPCPRSGCPTPSPAAPQRRDRPDTQPWTLLTDAPTEPPRLARQLCRISSRQERTERIIANLENHRRAAALADGTEPPDMDGILFVGLDLAVDHIGGSVRQVTPDGRNGA